MCFYPIPQICLADVAQMSTLESAVQTMQLDLEQARQQRKQDSAKADEVSRLTREIAGLQAELDGVHWQLERARG